MMEDHKLQQEEEIEALQAIYGDDFRKVTSQTAWQSVNAASEFEIRVDVQDPPAKVNLHFKLPLQYPDKLPTFSLENASGISSNHLTRLKSEMVRKAKENIGTAMIFDLVTLVNDFISDNVKSEGTQFASLDEQMRSRLEEEEEAHNKQAREAEAHRQAELEKENEEQTRLIEEDLKRKEEKRQREKRLHEKINQVPSSFVTNPSTPTPNRSTTLQPATPLAHHGHGMMMTTTTMTSSSSNNEATSVTDFHNLPMGGLQRLRGKSVSGADDSAEVFDPPIELRDGTMCRRVNVGARLSRPGTFPDVFHADLLHDDLSIVGSANLLRVDLCSPSFTHGGSGRHRIESIAQAATRVAGVRHSNVHLTYGSSLSRLQASLLRKFDGWRLTVLVEPLDPLESPTLETVIRASDSLRPERAFPYLFEIVSALQALHSSNIPHRSLNVQNVVVTTKSQEPSRIKLMYPFWFASLRDLNTSDSFAPNWVKEDVPTGWLPPIPNNPNLHVQKARDIWAAGVCFVQMMFGLDVVSQYHSPKGFMSKGPALDPNIKSLLNLLFSSQAKKWVSANKVLSFMNQMSENGSPAEISSPPLSVPTSLIPLSSVGGAGASNPKAMLKGRFWQPSRALTPTVPQGPSPSRFAQDWEEMGKLGKGAFGEVVKARNKLDGKLYAIKKIKLPNDEEAQAKVLREVTTTWPKMNHLHVIRYHSCWVEERADASTTNSSNSTDGESDDDGDDEVSVSSSLTPTRQSSGSLGLGFKDEDFMSFSDPIDDVLGASFISFGRGSDDEEESEEVNTESMGSSSHTRTPFGRARFLFIQMELINGLTLREAIDNTNLTEDPDRAWRLFRQILQAIDHFSSLNIIHRDLKPSNILLDEQDQPKIADFGLAVDEIDDHSIGIFGSGLLRIQGGIDMTSEVGTALYTAPEVSKREKGRGYTAKADVYSLGILFFELFWKFRTSSERLKVLTDLRRSVEFPADWPFTDWPMQTQIIRQCLSHDPEHRPTPRQLLELLPAMPGDQIVDEAVRLLTSNTTYAKTLLHALFNQTQSKAIEFSYDHQTTDSQRMEKLVMESYAENIKAGLRVIFKLRGAVELDAPLLMPASSMPVGGPPVCMLDVDGNVLMLPYDLTYPFCRLVARDSTRTRFKRYTIADVYRPSPLGGQPRQPVAASYDLVSQSHTEAAEAELISVVEDALRMIPFSSETPVQHVFTHSDLWAAILEGMPESIRAHVREALQGCKFMRFDKVASSLPKGVGQRWISYLETFAMCDDVEVVREHIFHLYPSMKAALEPALNNLAAIIKLTKGLTQRPVVIAPLMPPSQLVRDAYFQTCVGAKYVLAVGGRYDYLVQQLLPPSRKTASSVCGTSLNLARLADEAARQRGPPPNKFRRSVGETWGIRRCDCYLVSLQPGLIQARLELASALWDAGVSCDLMYESAPYEYELESMMQLCKQEGIRYLIIVKEPSLQRPSLKVKDVQAATEEEVSRGELAAWLQLHLQARARNIAPPHSTNDSQTAATTAAKDVIVCLPSSDKQPKNKQAKYRPSHSDKSRQAAFAEKASEQVGKAMKGSQNLPVFAVDLESDTFKAIMENPAWISSEETFKRVSATSGKRAYLSEIRETILEEKEASNTRWCWLCSSNQGCVLQPLDFA